MAKVQNAKQSNAVKWVSIGLGVIVMFTGIVGTWKVYGKDIETNATGVSTNKTSIAAVDTTNKEAVTGAKKEAKRDIRHLERDGCKPAGKNTIGAALIQKDIVTILTDQAELKTGMKEMRTEQRAGFKEILDRLPVK